MLKNNLIIIVKNNTNKLPSQLYELDVAQFFLGLGVILILYGVLFYVMLFIGIIWHEFGHLIFGYIFYKQYIFKTNLYVKCWN